MKKVKNIYKMKIFKKIILLLSILPIISCSKDDDNSTPTPNPADSVYRVTEVRNASGVVSASYIYNTQGKMSKAVFSNGVFSNYSYNAQGLLITNEYAGAVNPDDNYTTNYVYDAAGAKIEEIATRSNGSKYKTIYTNNSSGLPTESNYFVWNTATSSWNESANNRYLYFYNGRNQLVRFQRTTGYFLSPYDDRGNNIEYKQYNKKADGSYYVRYQNNITFDDKKATILNPFKPENPNNYLTFSSKTFAEDGTISNQTSSPPYSYEYNEADYVTKQFINGVLNGTYILEKVQ